MTRTLLTSVGLAAVLSLTTMLASRPARAQVEPVDPNAGINQGRQVGAHVLFAPGAVLGGAGVEIYAGQWGFEVTAGALAYTYSEDEGNYEYNEKGTGFLANARGRLYPVTDGSSIWIGAGVALGYSSYNWEEDDNGTTTDGSGGGVFIAPNAGFGYKALLGERLVIDPQLMVGISSSANDVSFIGGLGVGAGITF